MSLVTRSLQRFQGRGLGRRECLLNNMLLLCPGTQAPPRRARALSSSWACRACQRPWSEAPAAADGGGEGRGAAWLSSLLQSQAGAQERQGHLEVEGRGRSSSCSLNGAGEKARQAVEWNVGERQG